ncbi:MAG: hypothetical protein ABEL76_04715 [Bradymonadaceae bacterium]
MDDDRSTGPAPGDSSIPTDDQGATDPSDPQRFGEAFFDAVYRMLKVGSIFESDQEQTRNAVDDFRSFARKSLADTSLRALSFGIRGEFASVNGHTIRLSQQDQRRLRELRELFADAEIRTLSFGRNLTADELVELLDELREIRNADEEQRLEGFETSHLEYDSGSPDRDVLEALGEVTVREYSAHLYLRLAVKVGRLHERIEEESDTTADLPTLRRIVDRIAELFDGDRFDILRLPTTDLLEAGPALHSVNTAIYSMLMIDRLGLRPGRVGASGLAILLRDVDRTRGVDLADPAEAGAPNERLATANARAVARVSGRLDGSPASSLRAILLHERGIELERTIGPPFYKRERRVHVVRRAADIARTYDRLLAGSDGNEPRDPSTAIEALKRRGDSELDPALVELFVETMGDYPVGTTVELSSGERARVVGPPAAESASDRPHIRLLERDGQPVVDLGDPNYQRASIDRAVAEGEEPTEADDSGDDLFLLD